MEAVSGERIMAETRIADTVVAVLAANSDWRWRLMAAHAPAAKIKLDVTGLPCDHHTEVNQGRVIRT